LELPEFAAPAHGGRSITRVNTDTIQGTKHRDKDDFCAASTARPCQIRERIFIEMAWTFGELRL
jgi:hypothetical protein